MLRAVIVGNIVSLNLVNCVQQEILHVLGMIPLCFFVLMFRWICVVVCQSGKSQAWLAGEA